MQFISKEHKDFYNSQLAKTKSDCYHKALFYVLGIDSDTRSCINELFDFDDDCIKFDSDNRGWVTSTTVRLVRLAFNLWNGYIDDENAHRYTPYELFSYVPFEYIKFMLIGISLSRDF